MNVIGSRSRLTHTRSALWILCLAKFGSVALAARAAGLHSNTMYRATAGLNVSPDSRAKIERLFGSVYSRLILPLSFDSEACEVGV